MAISSQSPRIYCSRCMRRRNRAPRFFKVPAIAEAALPEVRPEFHECRGKFVESEMMDAESLHTGRVDQVALRIEMVQPRMRSGVFAGAQ